MKNFIKILYSLLLSSMLFACQYDYNPMVSLGVDDVYLIPRMKSLHLKPEFTGESYVWKLSSSSTSDSIVGNQKNFVFLASSSGNYYLDFEIKDKKNPFKHSIKIVVVDEQVSYSPYISKVYEFKPAPGQFVNKLPPYETGDDEESMRQKAEEYLARNNSQMVSLGGFGGYITFGFDHTVINVKGEYDFKINGNAFVAATHLQSERKGGSSEPGIVMVAFDDNNNGIPDDKWYELAGSEYHKPETIKHYEIVYHKPAPNKPPVQGTGNNAVLTDMRYIPWKDNQGKEGFLYKNKFHSQPYWPLWINEQKTTLKFSGTKLLNNAVDESSTQNGSYFVQYFYPWGYADNQPNGDDEGFKIDWAVDENGNPVQLKGIDFIRVYTGLNQYSGWLGETSTEISGARDLHIPIKPNINL